MKRITDERLADLLADKYKRSDVNEIVQALKAERKRIAELEVALHERRQECFDWIKINAEKDKHIAELKTEIQQGENNVQSRS
jgi:anti-sigma28 factor (negative regulator of flagellin synthesis)